MNKSERHAIIIDDLDREPALRVNELAKRYDVSPETIRRDLGELKERGLIGRTYGGAVRLISREPALSERQNLMVPERARIARAAVERIEKDDVLMIGGGITTHSFAQALTAFRDPLTVITPSFGVALTLGPCANIRVQVLPGQFNSKEGMIEGPDTIQALSRFRATKAFLGASGITGEGPSDAAISAGQIYQTMVERSSQACVLADSSKFEKPALSCYSTWSPDMTLICDLQPSASLSRAITQTGARIELAGAN